MSMFIFRDVWVLSFILLLPLLILSAKARRGAAHFIFPSEELVKEYAPTLKMRLVGSLTYMRAIALALIIMALARPQSVLEGTKTTSEGVDIVLTLDTSTSMLAEDFRIGSKRVNRFDALKEVVKEFVKKRKDDRIGMVAFAARAYTVCPLTTDYEWLYENLDRVRVGMIEDATAVGSAIASSLNRLRGSKTKSRVIILLTDGVNNAGTISPIVAAEAARSLKIKIYSIGIGTKGLVPYPFKDYYGRTVYQNILIEVDEDTLKKAAEITGGKYYRGQDTEGLRQIYEEINRLEKSTIEHSGYMEHTELFHYFLIPGLVVLGLEILLANTVFLKIP